MNFYVLVLVHLRISDMEKLEVEIRVLAVVLVKIEIFTIVE